MIKADDVHDYRKIASAINSIIAEKRKQLNEIEKSDAEIARLKQFLEDTLKAHPAALNMPAESWSRRIALEIEKELRTLEAAKQPESK